MFRGFVWGETVELRDRDGAWGWSRWSYRDKVDFPSAPDAALKAFASVGAEYAPGAGAFIDALLGVLEEPGREGSPAAEHARDILARADPHGGGEVAADQRALLRLLGVTRRDAVLFERVTLGLAPRSALLVELRRGALPPAASRPDCIGDLALGYAEAPERPEPRGTERVRIAQGGSGEYRLEPPLSAVSFGTSGGAGFGAVDAARAMGLARLEISGDFVPPSTIPYGEAYGIEVEFVD